MIIDNTFYLPGKELRTVLAFIHVLIRKILARASIMCFPLTMPPPGCEVSHCFFFKLS